MDIFVAALIVFGVGGVTVYGIISLVRNLKQPPDPSRNEHDQASGEERER